MNPKKEYPISANMNGEERAYVVTGQYEAVLPMDVHPQHLIKSIMIGDNPETDIRGAQNCDMHTVLFNPHQQSHDVNSTEIQGLKELKILL